jgi:hypothetical protein
MFFAPPFDYLDGFLGFRAVALRNWLPLYDRIHTLCEGPTRAVNLALAVGHGPTVEDLSGGLTRVALRSPAHAGWTHFGLG